MSQQMTSICVFFNVCLMIPMVVAGLLPSGKHAVLNISLILEWRRLLKQSVLHRQKFRKATRESDHNNVVEDDSDTGWASGFMRSQIYNKSEIKVLRIVIVLKWNKNWPFSGYDWPMQDFIREIAANNFRKDSRRFYYRFIMVWTWCETCRLSSVIQRTGLIWRLVMMKRLRVQALILATLSVNF